jgi:WD40 repeat protein
MAELKIWDLASKEEAPSRRVRTDEFRSLVFSRDGKTYASAGGQGGTVMLYNLATGDLLAAFPGPPGMPLCVAYSADSKVLAAGGGAGVVKLWNVAARKELAAFRTVVDGAVATVAFSPDGKTLAVSGGVRELRLWDVSGAAAPGR